MSNNQRMIVGSFQGANAQDFSDAVDLFLVPAAPAYSIYTIAAITPRTTAFRYLRYLAPANSFGNVSEVKFYGVSIPAAPTGVAVTMQNGAASLSWNGISFVNGYNVKRA